MANHRRSSSVWDKIMREAADADRDNVESFEPEGEPHLDQSQLEGFEKVVNEWLDRQEGQERKAKAVTWFSEMLARLRVKIGTTAPDSDRLKALDEIGMTIVSDQVVTLDGHSSVGFKRLAPLLSKLVFEGQESVRIVGKEELEAVKDALKVNVAGNELAVREIVFKDAVTGKKEVRRYALVDGDVTRIKNGRVQRPWLTFSEDYALSLVKAILSEVSK